MRIDKETLSNLLIILGMLLAIVMSLWYLFGQSPTTEQLLMAYILTPFLFTFGIYERLNGKVEKINDKLSKTREDFQHQLGEIRQTLGRIEGKPNTKKSI